MGTGGVVFRCSRGTCDKEQSDRRGIKHLLDEQRKARRDEVFGGFTAGERRAYEARRSRIHDLTEEILEVRRKEAEANLTAAKQRHDWNEQAQTDTSQNEARQPYRSRESDSSRAFTDSQKRSRTKKKNPDQSPDN